MLEPLSEVKQSRDALLASGVLDFVVRFSLRVADFGKDREPDDRMAALSILTDIWIKYPGIIEKQESTTSQAMLMYKRGCWDSFWPIWIVSLNFLFRLLDVFSWERNPFAPIIYKTIVFSLIDNHADFQTREFIMNNFSHLL